MNSFICMYKYYVQFITNNSFVFLNFILSYDKVYIGHIDNKYSTDF